jgi:hypothetical protein
MNGVVPSDRTEDLNQSFFLLLRGSSKGKVALLSWYAEDESRFSCLRSRANRCYSVVVDGGELERDGVSGRRVMASSDEERR